MLSFLCSLIVNVSDWGAVSQNATYFTWIKVNDLSLKWGLMADSLTRSMMMVVTTVSMVVHIYSLGYMKKDPCLPRFMAYLNLFTFTMMVLITAPSLPQLFLGWEGVGLASYLLIGFWYDKDSANKAAIKAFVTNRIADMSLVLAMSALFLMFKTLDFNEIFSLLPQFSINQNFSINFGWFEVHAITLVAILLIVGAMGKSAQFGLHVWLPDAMEGPTPVSALIHAATMVTAGIFLIIRFSPLMEYAPIAKDMMVIIGGITALFAATVAVGQSDIKKVIAYSTCSQLGYMMMACGVSAYIASFFHLATHAFFKALLFLGAGSLIHAMSGEQDIFKMGGVRKLVPITYMFMWVGNLALAGIPFFAGYYSKDLILEYLAQGEIIAQFGFVCGIIAALLTAFYSWRVLIIAFHGESRSTEAVIAHVHESPKIMTLPMGILFLGALFAGFFGEQIFVKQELGFKWFTSVVPLPHLHHLKFIYEIMPLVAGVLGIAIAFYLFQNNPRQWQGKIAAFLANSWYINEFYQKIIITPMFKLGNFFWQKGDVGTIDRFGPNGIAKRFSTFSYNFNFLQTGYIFHYVFIMVVGFVVLVGLYLIHVYNPNLLLPIKKVFS